MLREYESLLSTFLQSKRLVAPFNRLSANDTDEKLATLDRGGFAALVELLTVYSLDDNGGYHQIEGDAN